MPEETVAFFAYAKELFPHAHLRLYTSGDLLTQELLEELKAAGLDEIRFSVKHDDPEPLLEKVFERMAWARATLPVVMVEMPVIPGMEEFMRTLLDVYKRQATDRGARHNATLFHGVIEMCIRDSPYARHA